MPKTVFDKKPRCEKLHALLIGTARAKGKLNPELARMAGLGESTIYTRFKHPENFTIDEILRIGRGLNIPIEELRQAIIY